MYVVRMGTMPAHPWQVEDEDTGMVLQDTRGKLIGYSRTLPEAERKRDKANNRRKK